MRILFSCSEHVGHLNPTLPLVRALVDGGHEVHFMCAEMAKAKIEAAGAIFHDIMEIQAELYMGREKGCQAIFQLMQELQLEMCFLNVLKCLNVSLLQELPGTLRFMRALAPQVVVYDPLIVSRAAPLAARVLRVRAVGLLTLAGPGAMKDHGPALLPGSLEAAGEELRAYAPHLEATKELNERYGLQLKETHLLPDGYLDSMCGNLVLVTTSEALQDPPTAAVQAAYAACQACFRFVGPLLPAPQPDGLAERLRAHQGRRVAVSMGTVITGEDKVVGWRADCEGRSLTGQELCRAVWQGVFEACADLEDVLVVAALGRQPEPLGDVAVPGNVICVPSFAQVELLRSGLDLFVTHGGQNSFTEALAHGAPLVVCPGFGDQETNGLKAVALGVGLQVARPRLAGEELREEVRKGYQEEVKSKVRRVMEDPGFAARAAAQQLELGRCGGLECAVDLVLNGHLAAAGA